MNQREKDQKNNSEQCALNWSSPNKLACVAAVAHQADGRCKQALALALPFIEDQ